MPAGVIVAICLLLVSVVTSNVSGIFKDRNLSTTVHELKIDNQGLQLHNDRADYAAVCRSKKAGLITAAQARLTAATGRALAVVAGSVIDDPALADLVAKALAGDKASADDLPDLMRREVKHILESSDAAARAGLDRADVEAQCSAEALHVYPRVGVIREPPPTTTTTLPPPLTTTPR